MSKQVLSGFWCGVTHHEHVLRWYLQPSMKFRADVKGVSVFTISVHLVQRKLCHFDLNLSHPVSPAQEVELSNDYHIHSYLHPKKLASCDQNRVKVYWLVILRAKLLDNNFELVTFS